MNLPPTFTITAEDRMVIVENAATRSELTIRDTLFLIDELMRGMIAAARQVGEQDGRAYEKAMAEVRQQRSPR